MRGLPSPFGGGDRDDLFDDRGTFVPEHLPEPGPFLAGHEVLVGADHVGFHGTTRELFEERGVYDMTFDYNLARLNLDTRHGDAGYRYALERDPASVDRATPRDEAAPDADAVLRAEFTPTTPFCPQAHALTEASFRAWNAERDRHDYDLVRVRAAPMHHHSDEINARLAELEERFLATGEVAGSEAPSAGAAPADRSKPEEESATGREESPF